MTPEPAASSGTPTREAPGAIPGLYEPHVGDTVMDAVSRRVGRVMGFVGGYVQLRPVGGGIEWDALAENLRPATQAEALSAGVSVANARSRGECT